MKILEITDEFIKFDNDLTLTAEHEQDCCESVYAEFTALNNYNISTKTGKTIKIQDLDFSANIQELIEPVDGMGFNIVSNDGKYFIPCHNDQNGYYSSNLTLKMGKVSLDISDCVKDIGEQCRDY